MQPAEIQNQSKVNKDLLIIAIASLISLVIFLGFGNPIIEFARNSDANIWLRGLPVVVLQFGLAGLGCTIVILYRKEKLRDYGLVTRNMVPGILLSALACVPAFVFMWLNNEISSYLPLRRCLLTGEYLAAGFPTNALGYLLVATVWGFFEGFNYVVISKKINELSPSTNPWLNYGAIISGVLCVLIHGMIGFDLYTILGALTTFIIIYGMLLAKEKTGNAWGCIFVFLFFWNAL